MKIVLPDAQRIGGFTMVEVAFVLLIVAVLTSVFVAHLGGLRGSDSLNRASEMVYNDLMLMRTRAISTRATHRMHFTSDSEWKIEAYQTGTIPATWLQVGEVRRMPADTNLLSGTLQSVSSNLHATSRGIFEFQNGISGNPYISIESLGESRIKTIFVDPGGAVQINTQ